MLEQMIAEVHNLIRKANSKEDLTAVPHSDDFAKHVQSILGITPTDLKLYVSILKDSHMIFVFEIVKEDPDHEIKKIEGYVDADLHTISRLKNYYQHRLMEEYEKRFHKHVLVHQIIKEIFPNIKMYNNTSLGFIANKAIMLEEYENLVEKDYSDYSEENKNALFRDIISEHQKSTLSHESQIGSGDMPAAQAQDASSRRAIDSEEYRNFPNKNSKESIRKMLKVYGVDFFYRVHLRKYDFEIIFSAVEMREIDRKPDLKILKDHLKKLKMNYDRDPELEKYSDQIYRLERIISRHITSAHA
jgi:hypothetical protein